MNKQWTAGFLFTRVNKDEQKTVTNVFAHGSFMLVNTLMLTNKPLLQSVTAIVLFYQSIYNIIF